jgi:hypothetical protein
MRIVGRCRQLKHDGYSEVMFWAEGYHRDVYILFFDGIE